MKPVLDFFALVPITAWFYLFGIQCGYSLLPLKYRDYRPDLVISLTIACLFEFLVPLTVFFQLPFVVNPLAWTTAVFSCLVCAVLCPKQWAGWKQGILVIMYFLIYPTEVQELPTCYGYARDRPGCTPNSTMEMILQGVFCNQSSAPAITHCQKVLKPHLWEKQRIQFANGEYCRTPLQVTLIEACIVQDYWNTYNLSRACRSGLTQRAFLIIQDYIAEYEECKARPSSSACREIKNSYQQHLFARTDETCQLFRPIYYWLLDQD